MAQAAPRCRLLVLALTAGLLAAPAAWSADKVTGKYIGNGKEAKLVHVVVLPHEPWDDQTAYQIILSEKDPAGVKRPDVDAMFGKLGDALVVAVTEKGDVFSTQVCHQSLEKSGFSSSGTLFVEGFKIEGGQLSGRLFTEGKKEFFGDTWEIDLTVQAALPGKK